MKKSRDWLANFDLSLMARRCKQTSALAASEHEHVQLRGSVNADEGKIKLVAYSGHHSTAESALYVTALKLALKKTPKTEKKGVKTRLSRIMQSGREKGPAAADRGSSPGQLRGALAGLSREGDSGSERERVLIGRNGPAVPANPRK